MHSPRVVTHGGVTLNLASIKCFKVQTNINVGNGNVLYIEHKTRFDYIHNPITGALEKQEYNDRTEVEYASWEQAEKMRDEWEEIWQEYLDEQG